MGLNSINTNIAAYFAQQNIDKASSKVSSSIGRLSSGNRIVRAADDVAAMSAGTSLRTNVTTLRMALINTSQGSSLLQVADGALSQITDILQRQKAIAVQANSGSLTSSERGFLNQEFTNLSAEIDRLVDNTNFNGVALLDGALSERVNVTSNNTGATQGSMSIAFNVNPGNNETLRFITLGAGGAGNQVDFNSTVAGNQDITFVTAAPSLAQHVRIGASVQETLENLVVFLNSSDILGANGLTASRQGNLITLTDRAGGTQGQVFTIDVGNSTALNATVGDVVVNGGGASAILNAFSANLISAASIDDVVVNATPSATEQFDTGAVNIAVPNLNGGAAQTLATLTAGQTLKEVVDAMNANTAQTGITARIIGSSGAYNIEFEHFAVDLTNTTLADMALTFANAPDTSLTAVLNTGLATVNNRVFSLTGADDVGIGIGDTVGVGTIGDTILTGQTQTKSSVQLIFPEIADADLLTTANFGAATAMNIAIGEGANEVIFTFSVGGGGPTDIEVGATLEETLDNAAAAINSYYGNARDNYNLSQVDVRRDGNSLVISTRHYGDGIGYGGNALDVDSNLTVTGSSLTNSGTLTNGDTGGVTTAGVTNADFVGTISGFAATYSGTADSLTLNVTIGDHSYSADVSDTTPSSDTTVRFLSQDGGGYFDVELAANEGISVTSQANADVFAQRVNAAFQSLTFYQNRTVSSYNGSAPIVTNGQTTGSLIGTTLEMQLESFADVVIDDVAIEAPYGSSTNGSITFTVSGEEFRSAANIGETLGANQTYRFTSVQDANRYIEFTTGSVAIDFSDSDKAQAFETALKQALGVGTNSAKVQFQVGVTTEDTLAVEIRRADTNTIFNGEDLDVLTIANASHASDVIDEALDIITSIRADVGALQSRFDFAAANIQISLQNQDAARGVLLDTDIAAESSMYATSQVQLQAGISVLAQANLIPQNLLKLIG